MHRGKQSVRRATGVAVLLACLVVALLVPSVAFAGSFTAQTPTGNITNTTPKIIVAFYDKAGTRGNSNRWMYLDGVRHYPTIQYWPGSGYTKLTATYQVPWALPLGTHTVIEKFRNQAGGTSSTSWTFTVVSPGPPADVVAPSTASDVVPSYASLATIHLSATDNVGGSGVAHTYYMLDGGAQTPYGTSITVSASGLHILQFWSVDNAGNVETQRMVVFSVTNLDLTAPATTSDTTSTPYRGSAVIQLTATDTGGSGVAHTYYILDGGAQAASPWVMTSDVGSHSLQFWSVDVAGNIETPHTVSFTVLDVHAMPALGECTCHAATSLVSLHKGDCSRCHSGSGTPLANCSACHPATVALMHPSAQTHTLITPPSSNTTDTACVSAGCHSKDLVTAHNGGSCATSCHDTYVAPLPQACTCHGFAANRPTGDLAANIAAATANNGAGLVCTTCHNTSSHMGHTPHGYYTVPWGKNTTASVAATGEAPLHAAITSATVGSSDTTNTGCVTCHGVNGAADLAMVHKNLSGCFCHTQSQYAALITSGTPVAQNGSGRPIKCTDCHPGWEAQHVAKHALITPPSSNTTDTACVSSHCHTNELIEAHNSASCATCHTSAPYNTMPGSCFCHAAVLARPTGNLAADMAAATANHGVGLVCTTCHNTSSHMGHTPYGYYTVPWGKNTTASVAATGEAPLHAAITSATVSHETTNTQCVSSGCHGNSTGSADLAMVHKNLSGCFCHTQSQYASTITSGSPVAQGGHGIPIKCTDCHSASIAANHPDQTADHAVSGPCFASTCHGTDVSKMHTIDFRGTGAATIPGCSACHALGKTPSTNCGLCHSDLVTPHDYAKAHASVTTMIDANSSACTACHGDDLTKVATKNANGTYTVPSNGGTLEHNGCSCHAYGEAGQNGGNLPAGQVGCQNCHGTAQYSVHDFGKGFTASGHNTTTFGTIGARTEFDGLNGSPQLLWTSRSASSTFVVPTTQAGGSVTGISVGSTGTVGTQWNFPTVNVFWNSSDASAPVGAEKGLTSSSVITCQDCHTDLSLNPAGPHGAAQYWGIDSNYKADYSYARLTKWIVTNPSGIGVLSTLDTITVSATTGLITSDAQHPSMVGQVAQYGQNDGTQGRVICQKCHDLMSVNTGTAYNTITGSTYQWWYNGGTPASTVQTSTNTGLINYAVVGTSNTAHGSHHQDTGTMNVDGSPQCVNCHVGLPHGWKRPRLLLDTDQDAAPYRSPDQLGTTQSGSSGIKNTGNTIGAGYATSGWAPHPGFNGQGMQSLSAVDQHTLVNGAAVWGEPNCEACGFHTGQDGTPALPSNAGVRIN